MSELQNYKLQANRWVINARWYYLIGIAIICFLAKYREFQSFDFLNTIDADLYILFGLLWLANSLFLVWIKLVEIKQSARWLSLLGYVQVITEIVLLVLLVYKLGGVDGIMPVALVVPIIESIILFGGFYPAVLAVTIVLAINLLFLTQSSNILSWFARQTPTFELKADWSGVLLAKTELISLIYVIIGFFSTFVSGLIRSRETLLATKAAEEEVQINELRNFNQELEANARELATKDLELSMANKQLENLEAAKSKFISVTAHQMRTPLSAIKWTFEMMKSGQLGVVTDEQKNFLDKGFASTERMIYIVNDLLNADQIETERLKYNFAPTELGKLIDVVLLEFTNQAKSKKIKILYDKSAKPLPAIELDAQKIRIVLENLLDNAVKYTPAGGQVTIKTLDDKVNSTRNSVEVLISDTGVGIPSAEQEKIFHKFFRAQNAVKMDPNGTGIGLFLSRDIIERHGGTIWFDSGKQGGVSFHFTLPLKQTG